MVIYVIRHGKAQIGSDSGCDEDRVLRKKGLRQAQWLARVLGQECPRPAVVLSSPYTRARQTAGPIWEMLDLEPRIDERLGAGRSLSDALDVLIDARNAGVVAVVGHNPTCARLVSLLCHGPAATSGGHRTGEMALVRIVGDGLVGEGELIERFRLVEE